MKIRILGTKANIELNKPYHSKKSGVLIDDCILLDAGEKEFLEHHPHALLFTHFHPDHAWFINNSDHVDLSIPIYGPEPQPKVTAMKVVTEPIDLLGYNITPVRTIHSINVKSQGYVVEKKGRRIFYSGDIAWIEKRYYNRLQNLDLVITECSYFRKGGRILRNKETGRIYGHAGVPDLIRVFRKFTNRIVFMHLGTWFMENIKDGRKKIRSLEDEDLHLDIAIDGKEYII